MSGKVEDAAIACRARSTLVGYVRFGVGVCGMGVFRLEKMELGWRVVLLERKCGYGLVESLFHWCGWRPCVPLLKG